MLFSESLFSLLLFPELPLPDPLLPEPLFPEPPLLPDPLPLEPLFPLLEVLLELDFFELEDEEEPEELLLADLASQFSEAGATPTFIAA